jgi:hypothetical protein
VDQLAILDLESVRAFLGHSTVLRNLTEFVTHNLLRDCHLHLAFLRIKFEIFDHLLNTENFKLQIVAELVSVAHACYVVHGLVY